MKSNYLSLAIGLALAAGSVQAQESAKSPSESESAKALDSVTVTARRRSESIQDVPVAVSAFSEDDVKNLQATNIDGLQGAVPNLNIVQGRGSSNSVNVFIRGIGQPDALQTFDPGVGMYVDDVYYSRINGALFSLFDVQQIEVLRGPQGTLYGKNSTGGAIKITTKNPFDDETGSLELTGGNFGRAEGRFYASGKLNDVVAMSVAAGMITNDGYVTDPLTGKSYNDQDTKSIRTKLALRPTDNLQINVAFDYTKQDNALTLGRPMANLGGVPPLAAETGEYDFESSTSFSPDKGQQLTHKGLTVSADWQINDRWLFKAINAHRKLDTESYIDIDASQRELGDVLVAVDQSQTSQEIQLQYDGETLDATFGVYYMSEHVPSHQEAYADNLFGVSFLRTIDDDLETRSRAAFVHASWEFAPSWTLAAGLRYTRDDKDYVRSTSTFWGAPFTFLNGTVALDVSKGWSATTPSFSLQKAFSDNMMGYVSANRGFKSGGFNGRANTVAEAANPEYDPEFVWTYEAGLKMSSADNRMRGSMAVFKSDYTDFQARVSQDVGTFPVLNAAELDIKGVEFEGMMLLGESTTLSGQVGWLDAEYAKFEDFRLDPTFPGYNPTVNHDHVPFSPEWTARVALTHTIGLSNGSSLTFGGDASYRDKAWLSVDNRDVLTQDAFTLVGLFGVWDSADTTWQARVGVRNLTDEVYKTDAQEFASVGNIQTAYYGMPRNWYASIRYNF